MGNRENIPGYLGFFLWGSEPAGDVSLLHFCVFSGPFYQVKEVTVGLWTRWQSCQRELACACTRVHLLCAQWDNASCPCPT